MEITSHGQQHNCNVTMLLKQWSGGDSAALAALMPILHRELLDLAHSLLRHERLGHTLESGALVNEAWLRLVRLTEADCSDRSRFFGLCAQLMRRILVDHARSRLRTKRGGQLCRITLSDCLPQSTNAALIAINDALIALAAFDARKARVVELRYFGGLSVEDVSRVLGISPETVKRDWKIARLWMAREFERSSVRT